MTSRRTAACLRRHAAVPTAQTGDAGCRRLAPSCPRRCRRATSGRAAPTKRRLDKSDDASDQSGVLRAESSPAAGASRAGGSVAVAWARRGVRRAEPPSSPDVSWRAGLLSIQPARLDCAAFLPSWVTLDANRLFVGRQLSANCLSSTEASPWASARRGTVEGSKDAALCCECSELRAEPALLRERDVKIELDGERREGGGGED